MAQHEINLPCIADTYLDDDNPSTNYGSATSLLAGERRVLPPTGGDYSYFKRALLKFDIGSIKYKRIISAYLRIYITNVYQDTGGRTITRLMNVDFDEYEATAQKTKFIGPDYYSKNLSQVSTGYQEFNVFSSALYSTCVVVVSGKGYEFYPYIRFSSRETDNPPILKVIYEDVPPDKPTPITPVGIFKDSRAQIRFEWQYNSSVGGAQKKFELQWSTNQSDWTTISGTTENTYLDIPEDTFPVGNIYWRVRTYNEYDEVSEYSDIAAFYSIGAPDTPSIQSVSNSCRPLIQWASFGQQVYHVQVLQGETIIYDSGTIASISSRSHHVPVFIDNGQYMAQVRIKNEYDMWSEWGTYDFTISTTKPSKPTLSIQRTRYGQELMVAGTYDEVYIYRDGVCIGKDITHDNTPINGKEYEYFARAVSGDAFADSKTVLATASFRYGLLSDSEDIIELQHNISTVPGKNTINNQVGTANYYDGRKYPVYEHTEHADKSLMLTYFIKNYTDIERLEAMADRKNIVLYRDKRGRKLYGTMTGLTVQDIKQGFTVTFTIVATDYSEAIL